MTLADKVLSYHFNLRSSIDLPNGIQWLMPYDDEETKRCMTLFYNRFYRDENKRTFILGINPGRFGAGITGVPFTDPIRLETLGIDNSFQKRLELSSVFIYDMINEFGGPEEFYSKFYISSLSPLGFVKNGKNYNYYDDRVLAETVRPFIIKNIRNPNQFRSRFDQSVLSGPGEKL